MRSRTASLNPFVLTLLSLLTVSVGIVSVNAAHGDDWPQWRGLNRDGISAETGLLKEWPAEGPKLLWQVDKIGEGYSTPAVVGDHLYMISNQGMDNEYVQALSVADGKQAWQTTIGKVGPNEMPPYPGARSTPTVDGELLYALGSNGDLACLEIKGGKIRWQKNLREEFGGKPGVWAYSESPLVDGNALVVTPGGEGATIVALNKANGEVIWKSAIPGGDQAAYSSIIIVETAGVRQYVQFLQKGLVGIEAETGKFLWRYEKTAQGSPANIPTPVAKDNLIYSASGRGGAGLIKLTAKDGGVEATEVYSAQKLPTAIGGSVLIGDNLYGTTSGGLICADFATGDIKWQERAVGAASILFADGLLFLHGESGEVALVEASPEGYRERGKFTPPNAPDRGRSKAWAYPALADGRLYVHDWGTLWCYQVKADAQAAGAPNRRPTIRLVSDTAKRATDAKSAKDKKESSSGEWKQLFNGKNLDGWEHVGPGKFVVEDGLLKTEDGMGLLWYSKEKLGNCVLRVVYKQERQGSNSGVYVRIADKPDDPWFAVHNGYEIQIAGGSSPYRMTGSVYSFGKATANPAKGPGEWNTLEITLDGQRIKTAINGTPVTNFDPSQPPPPRENTPEFDDPHLGPRPEAGYIGLQNHDKNSIVRFKEVSVKPL